MELKRKQRRHLSAIVNEESIAKEIKYVLNHLAGAEQMQMPAASEEEDRRRREIIGEAAKRMFVAGLLCLKAYRPRQYSALATAAMRYLIETIESGTAAFTVKKPRGPKAFGEWMFGTSALAAYEQIVGQLKDAWKTEPTGVLRPLPPRAPRTRRYEEKHHLAGQLHYRRQADRIKAVQRAADSVVKMPVKDALARTWVKDLETPAAIGLAMMGHLMKRSPRAMKDLLNDARKQLKFAKDFDRIAAARRLKMAARAGVASDSQPAAPEKLRS